MVWDCTAGKFRWFFGGDEIVHIIEGEVIVSGDGAPRAYPQARDAALFRAGTWATWHVPHYVRKHAICRDSLPTFVTLPLRTVRKASRSSSASARPSRPAFRPLPSAPAFRSSVSASSARSACWASETTTPPRPSGLGALH